MAKGILKKNSIPELAAVQKIKFCQQMWKSSFQILFVVKILRLSQPFLLGKQHNDKTMLNAVRKAFATLSIFLLPISFLLAQQGNDFMRSMGKMYVVVAVIAAIFIGIVIFLIYLDRKLTRLENQINYHESRKTDR